jgi:PTS system ascorbate-specific IIC component
MPVLGSLGFANTTFSDFDFTVYGIFFGLLGKNLAQVGVIIGLVIVYGAMIAYSLLKKSPKPEAVEPVAA